MACRDYGDRGLPPGRARRVRNGWGQETGPTLLGALPRAGRKIAYEARLKREILAKINAAHILIGDNGLRHAFH